MTTNLVWLSTSVFCCRAVWNRILKEFISTFITEQFKEDLLVSYQIQFSYECGENIKLSLLTKKELAGKLAKKTDFFFKSSFCLFDFPKKEVQLPVYGLFRPFPANTIQYGLYKLPPLDDPEKLVKKRFQEELSLLMIEALGEDSIDEDIILTFAFYLHVTLIKMIVQYPEGIEMVMRIYAHDTNLNIQDNVLSDLVNAKFEGNKDVLLEITSDIINYQNNCNDHPVWLKKWILLIEEEIEFSLNLNDKKGEALVKINKKIINIIHAHLGITEAMEFALIYFINNIFPKFRSQMRSQT